MVVKGLIGSHVFQIQESAWFRDTCIIVFPYLKLTFPHIENAFGSMGIAGGFSKISRILHILRNPVGKGCQVDLARTADRGGGASRPGCVF